MAAPLLTLLALLAPALAAPALAPAPLLYAPPRLHARAAVVGIMDNGTLVVVDSTNNQTISQAPATDGGGTGFDVPALIWLACAFAAGAPLALLGLRLGRLTAATGLGCICAALVWTALVNTLGAPDIADIYVVAIALAAFGLGFLPGLLRALRPAALVALGLCGGAALGVRVVLLRPGLLIHKFDANWGLVVVCAVVGLLFVVVRQHVGVAFSCASIGSFLVALGIDLVLNKQSGMSRGLRYLFDRNDAHVLDMYNNPYKPGTTTYVLLGVSLGLTFFLAYAQHRLFSAPFYARPERPRVLLTDEDLAAPLRASCDSEKAPGSPLPPGMQRAADSESTLAGSPVRAKAGAAESSSSLVGGGVKEKG